MKTKSLLTLTCALGMLCLGGQANAALTVTNGDFSNLNGLTYEGGPWYSGVPTGWSTDKAGTTYSVLYTGNPTPGVFTYAGNLSQLSTSNPFAPLKQNVGTTDFTGAVTLKFDLSTLNPNGNSWDVGAAIYTNDFGTLLANRSIPNGYNDSNGIGTFELTTPSNVASGASLQIAFWTTSGTPGLTNVSISQVPEPGTWALLVGGLGMLGTLRRRSRQA
ncbi:MAG: PEP-CTERM sorting domain-containing protein [Verrucomicrobia bacterium]|jgi:hypothetical protein|nr:PEP-CTERM sorting domain-containing protein [Verrucomicrobiota bacterium]